MSLFSSIRFSIKFLIILTFVSSAGASNYPPFQREIIQWKTGQIIAVSQMFHNPTTFIYEIGTGSRFGHLGLVSVEADGIFVYEEEPPAAKKTPLEDFLKTATNPKTQEIQATLLEPSQPITDRQAQLLVAAAKEAVEKQIPYNFNLVSNPQSMNCAEFMRFVFERAELGPIGELSDFKSMNTEAFDGKLFDLVKLSRSTEGQSVTPVSVVNSPGLKVIATNLPVEQLMSEKEIYQIWAEAGATRRMMRFLKIPSTAQALLAESGSSTPYRAYPSTWRQSAPAKETKLLPASTSPAARCQQVLISP